MTSRRILRATFNRAAREYNAIRPGYPDALIEDIITRSGIPEGGKVLEIGCGTGQATLPFARRGYRILCLDIGANMLAVAKENLKAYPNVSFRHTSFEDWPARLGVFDLVFSATAFHWVPPGIGFPKAALALKPGAALAVFSNQHPRPFYGFFEEVQAIYRQYVPEWNDPTERPSTMDEIRSHAAYIEGTGLYQPVTVHTYPWNQTYSTEEYLRLLNTYSAHLHLEESRRRLLYQAIADLIERRYNGQIDRPYLAVLYLAMKK